jgi:hypothetical protein
VPKPKILIFMILLIIAKIRCPLTIQILDGIGTNIQAKNQISPGKALRAEMILFPIRLSGKVLASVF